MILMCLYAIVTERKSIFFHGQVFFFIAHALSVWADEGDSRAAAIFNKNFRLKGVFLVIKRRESWSFYFQIELWTKNKKKAWKTQRYVYFLYMCICRQNKLENK